jgi:uncharacterized protein YggL (DUF469 family)
MRQSTIPAEVNKKICDAFSCSAIATTEIAVKISQERAISVQLCEQCVGKFQDTEECVVNGQ